MNISIDLRGLERLNALPAQIAAAAEKGLDVGGVLMSRQKSQEITKTYSRRIRTNKNGTPSWKRTGDFQRGIEVEKGDGTRTIKTVGNAAKYEERLANLPTGPDGINRTNKASENAVKVAEPQIQRVIESEIRNALGL